MTWIARLAAPLLAVVLLAAGALAQDDQAPTQIAWSADLPAAIAKGKETERPVMVCINAKRVDGNRVDEPAAKGLREVVYRDPRVVAKSQKFVCVLLTAEGTSTEYDALRALGIDGDIISPQHVFIAAEGDRILHRKQYWRHGQGDEAVKALIEMMDKALAAAGKAPVAPPDASGAPEGGEARAAWIAERVEKVNADVEPRDRALAELVAADVDGDCTDPLIAFLPDYEKDISTLRALVRVLGVDGLERAALPLTDQLSHKDPSIRANAAVSLEYIGSSEKKVVAALLKYAKKEKEEDVANHMFRALGRCGVEDSKVRSLLLDEASSAKSEFASYGPCIGLSYFKGDEKAMRGVEKLLKQIGVPGGRRGGGQNTVKRGLVSWVLASIGDAKSGAFVRVELVAGLENVKAFWVEPMRVFWVNTARACEGEEGALGEVEAGVKAIVGFSKRGDLGRYGAEDRNLNDEARRNRDMEKFRPQGEQLLDDEAGDE